MKRDVPGDLVQKELVPGAKRVNPFPPSGNTVGISDGAPGHDLRRVSVFQQGTLQVGYGRVFTTAPLFVPALSLRAAASRCVILVQIGSKIQLPPNAGDAPGLGLLREVLAAHPQIVRRLRREIGNGSFDLVDRGVFSVTSKTNRKRSCPWSISSPISRAAILSPSSVFTGTLPKLQARSLTPVRNSAGCVLTASSNPESSPAYL